MTKYNFKQVRQEKGITAQTVAEAAGISLGVEYTFEIGGFVAPEIREQIIASFSALAKQDYHLDAFEGPKRAAPAPPPAPLFTRRKERTHASTSPVTTHP